jgi:hypothetical protein
LDDQGWFWAHSQWKTVGNAIRDEHTNTLANGLTIVVFVHGWQNNAAYDNGNVNMFRGVLTNLSDTLSPRKVFGVYVGWRGKSLEEPINYLSFYHRKVVAERIGHQGAATQVFTELEKMQDSFNEPLTNNQNQASNMLARTELIIIGHSFGGQLVYSAISQILTERLVLANNGKGLKSFGDLVVLVNPAFEASLYKNLQSLATSGGFDYPQAQRPVMAIFESKADSPNGFWFPFGRHLSTWYENLRPGGAKTNEIWMFSEKKDPNQNEHAAILHTVGFDNEFINYQLKYVYNSNNAPANGIATRQKSNGEEVARALKYTEMDLATNNAATGPSQLVPLVFDYYSTNSIPRMKEPPSPTRTNYYQCVLQPWTNYVPFKARNPFYNVAVDKEIISGHSDIANPIFLKFLRDFVLLTEPNFTSEAGKDK